MADEKRNLIDRDDLIDSLGVSDMDIYAKEVIGDAPTIDAVPVVRCKVCKHWCRNAGIADSPNGHCFCHDIETNGQDFCSYGERRSDDL